MAEPKRILWVDDEIAGLTSHILFLEHRGFAVKTAPNGQDALEMLGEDGFDGVLLDEQMPGMRGMTVFERIRDRHPRLPVVMVTKSEEEGLMDQAIGRRVDDYLVKPINPNQVLSVLNRLLEGFEGKMTSSKWAKLAKCSQDTALRDINDLLDRGILAKDEAGGRSTSYSLAEV